jgi:hypothetical protein
MRFVSAVLFTAFALAGCSDDPKKDAEPFDTYQLCYDDHVGEEHVPVQEAIEICCIDHPIGGAQANTVCGETAATCTTYVTAQVTPALMAADISAACADYVIQRNK